MPTNSSPSTELHQLRRSSNLSSSAAGRRKHTFPRRMPLPPSPRSLAARSEAARGIRYEAEAPLRLIPLDFRRDLPPKNASDSAAAGAGAGAAAEAAAGGGTAIAAGRPARGAAAALDRRPRRPHSPPPLRSVHYRRRRVPLFAGALDVAARGTSAGAVDAAGALPAPQGAARERGEASGHRPYPCAAVLGGGSLAPAAGRDRAAARRPRAERSTGRRSR